MTAVQEVVDVKVINMQPTSRMTNTYIAPGDDKAEDIIKSIDDGLYAKKMGGGSVNPVTGEFNFAVFRRIFS